MAKKTSKESIVHRLVSVVGDNSKHILEEMIDQDEAPILKSFGMARLGSESSSWVGYTITTRGSEVLRIDVTEPDMRGVAGDAAKYEFQCQIDKDTLSL